MFPTLNKSQLILFIGMVIVGALAYHTGGALSLMAVVTGFVVMILLTTE